MERLTSSPRLREIGIMIMRAASLGVIAVIAKNPKARSTALLHLESLARQLLS